MILRNWLQQRSRRFSRGAVIVEVCICVILFMWLLMGLIQYGMILHAMATLNQYAREGARYTADQWSNPYFNATSSTTSGTFPNYMSGIATSTNIPYSKITAGVYVPVSGTPTAISTSTCTSSCVSISKGTVCTVRVSYDMTQTYIFYGFIPGLHKPWTYTAQAAMVAE